MILGFLPLKLGGGEKIETAGVFCSGGIPLHSRQVKFDSGPMTPVSMVPRDAAYPPEACPFDRPPSPGRSKKEIVSVSPCLCGGFSPGFG
jgi:hypothetical protein